jgi:hypothetical protein
MDTPIETLRKHGWTPARLARALIGITPQAISQWRQVPAERVLEVERVTGINREVLRPDLAAIFIRPEPEPEIETDDEEADAA